MSNTTNLNLFKHDNPEQNTNPFDVEEALNKNWDKVDTYAGNVNEDITTINSNITNINRDITDIQTEQTTQNTNIQTNSDNISSLNTRVETNENNISNINTTVGTIQTTQNNKISAIVKLELENQRLKETLPTTTGTGENITLNKTAELDFVVPPLPEGNTKQNTTEGIQRIDTNETINETTVNGVTYSLKNGVFKFNGTATGFFYVTLTNKVNLESGDYTFAPSDESGSYTGTFGKYGYTNTDVLEGGQTKNLINRTLNEDYNDVVLRFFIANGCVFNNYQFKINLVKGTYTSSTIPAWEPYTNGASPNPSYEQEVQVVKGDVEVKVENGNLVNEDNLEVFDNNRYVKFNDNYYINAEPNTAYTLSIEVFAGDGKFVEYDENNNILKETSIYSILTNGYVTITTTANTKKIKFYAQMYSSVPSETPTKYTAKCMLEKGSTASPYTPHKEQKLPLTLENIELCKIEDYKDKFEKDNGVWKIPNKILKIDSYNGETITTPYISSTGGLDIGATVYYVGDNALEITDTTLISQLEAIYNAISYEGQTNISGTSSGINPLFDVEAYQSTKLLLENALDRLELLEN